MCYYSNKMCRELFKTPLKLKIKQLTSNLCASFVFSLFHTLYYTRITVQIKFKYFYEFIQNVEAKFGTMQYVEKKTNKHNIYYAVKA